MTVAIEERRTTSHLAIDQRLAELIDGVGTDALERQIEDVVVITEAVVGDVDRERPDDAVVCLVSTSVYLIKT